MSSVCALSPPDKRVQATRVGDDLLRHYGRKPYYSVEEVKAANRRNRISIDVECWSHAMFNSHEDFDAMHAALGEVCDYAGMKLQMLEAVSAGAGGWFDFDLDLSWLEFPDIDWSVFDFFD
ncbi:hypothetical protein [Lysobacter sp. CA199]|uniref:hypothetical protein n=1 Tax=Lysobacter sp. CA199 TaxID=3455608 RepID=UPI003F8D5591